MWTLYLRFIYSFYYLFDITLFHVDKAFFFLSSQYVYSLNPYYISRLPTFQILNEIVTLLCYVRSSSFSTPYIIFETYAHHSSARYFQYFFHNNKNGT